MANKQYAYYIEGNKVAIVEKGTGSGVCSLSGYSSKTTCEAAGGTWTNNAVGIDDGKWKNETRHKHLNVFYEKSFMPLHNDEQEDDTVHFICQNYPNIDRTIEDGSLFRYFIDKEFFDILTNYTTQVTFDIHKGAGEIPHLVTKNNTDKVRYSSYEVYRD